MYRGDGLSEASSSWRKVGMDIGGKGRCGTGDATVPGCVVALRFPPPFAFSCLCSLSFNGLGVARSGLLSDNPSRAEVWPLEECFLLIMGGVETVLEGSPARCGISRVVLAVWKKSLLWSPLYVSGRVVLSIGRPRGFCSSSDS